MTTLGDLDAAVQAAIQRNGRDAVVHVSVDRGDVVLAATPPGRTPHALRDTVATTAAYAAGAPQDVAHGLYLAQRAIGDARALRNDRLPNRLGRRWLTRNVWGKAMRRLG